MNEQHPPTMLQITGHVCSLFYLVDEPTTRLSIQANGQLITARASGQIALDLRALPRGAMICATLHDALPHDPQIVAFILISSWWVLSRSRVPPWVLRTVLCSIAHQLQIARGGV